MSQRPNAIRSERVSRGWSQLDLAERAGVDQSEISRWENGATFPSHKSVLRLAEAFGVSFARVYEWLEPAEGVA